MKSLSLALVLLFSVQQVSASWTDHSYYRECYLTDPLSSSDPAKDGPNIPQASIMYYYKNVGCNWEGCTGSIEIHPDGIYKPSLKVQALSHVGKDMNHLVGEGIWRDDFRSATEGSAISVEVRFESDSENFSNWGDDVGLFTYVENGVSKTLKLGCLSALID
jgi:hypothetical protein